MDTLFTLERFDRPSMLWLVLAVVLLWWMARRSLAGLGPVRGRLAMIVRSLVVVLLVLVVAGVHKILKNEDLTVLFLLDQSRSIPVEIRRQAEKFIAAACRSMRPDDRAAVITFDGGTGIEQLPSRPGPEGGLHMPPPFPDGRDPDRTNIAQGLRMAAAAALDTTNNRVVLLTDGNQNVGDLMTEVKAARANKIALDVVPLRFQRGAEVVFEQLRVPPYANLHEQILLRPILRSDRQADGTLLIYQKVGGEEELIDLDPDSDNSGIRVTLNPGRNAFAVRLPIKTARVHEYRGVFVPDNKAADALLQNNEARAFTNVEGRRTVLFVGALGTMEDDQPLVEALAKEEINVEYVTSDAAVLDASSLQDYAAVVLANVPAEHFSASQQTALATYVRDLGGGLLMLGGEDSFAAGGWQGSVVEEVMPVRFDVDAVREIPRGALAIVMHSCEMPEGNKWGIEVAVAALKTLSRLDYFGVVGWTFTGTNWEVPMQVASDKTGIIARIRVMQNGDMPDFESSMQMAYDGLMSCNDAAQRHMIIISDGDATPPSTMLINKLVGARITCSTVTIFPHGGGEPTMQEIARTTKGRHYLLNRPGDERQLPKIFVKEARVVRRPLIRNKDFIPQVRPHLSDIMEGVGKDFPMLKAYVVTTPRKVADVEMPLVTDTGDPLLAHWWCGFGRTVAFTSGMWKHWGAAWPAWSGYSKLWAQAVRWTMQQGSAADFDVSTTLDGNEGHVVIETGGDPDRAAAVGPLVARVVKPDNTATELPVQQTGPGRFEGRFKLDQMGAYLVNLQAAAGADGKPALIRTGLTLAYSPEFKDNATNESLLREILDESAGRLLSFEDDGRTVFARDLPPTISRLPIWDFLIKLAIFLFLLDVTVRRIAVDPGKTAAAARAYLASLAGRFGAGRRAEATLADLKTVRQRVRSEKTAEGDASIITRTTPPETTPGPDGGVRFEAGGLPKKPAKDLSEALGGPALDADQAGKPKPKPAGPQESTTARLLKAKRRARQDTDQDAGPKP